MAAKLGVDTAFLKGYLDTAKHLRAAAEPVLLPEICRRVQPEQENISSSPGNNKNKEQLDHAEKWGQPLEFSESIVQRDQILKKLKH